MPYSYHVQKSIKYINKNLDKNISLSTVSTYLNLNKCYFCTLFKEEVGESFSNYLNSLRIEHGKNLLKSGDMTMIEVAFASGYNSQSYFNNVFKKTTGMTPKKYQYENSVLN